MRVRYLYIIVLLVLLSCLNAMADSYIITPEWYEGKSAFRECYVDSNGELYDSYMLMSHDTVNAVDVGVEGDYNLLVTANIHNFHNSPYERYPLFYSDEEGEVKRGEGVVRPVYGWVWGMKDMQHYNALWMRSCPQDDYVYMSDVIEYCVVSVNGNDTVYHTPWKSYLHDEIMQREGLHNMWIEHNNNTVWIGGGYNMDIPWEIVYNMELYGPLTGVYVGEGASVRVSNPLIVVEKKEHLITTNFNAEVLSEYYSKEMTDPIEAFWEMNLDVRRDSDVKMGGRYKLGIIKQDNLYYIIYLGGSDVYPGKWKEGMVKGIMHPITSSEFEVEWYDAEGYVMNNVIATISANSELAYVFSDDSAILYFSKSNTQHNKDKNRDGNKEGKYLSNGSGFALTSDGYIATNYHVVEGARNIDIANDSLPVSYNAVIVAADPINDLAILKIEDERFTSLGEIPYGFQNRIPRKGENLLSLSYPKTDILGDELKASWGLVTALNGLVLSTYCISTEIDHGSSGSALFDENGNVVGIVVAKLSDGLASITANFAIKMPYLYRLIKQVEGIEENLPAGKISGLSTVDKIEALSPFMYQILIH